MGNVGSRARIALIRLVQSIGRLFIALLNGPSEFAAIVLGAALFVLPEQLSKRLALRVFPRC